MPIRSDLNISDVLSVSVSGYPGEQDAEIHDVIKSLVSIDAHYDQEYSAIETWDGPEPLKSYFVQEIERRHRRHREPYVHRLAELHQRAMAEAMIKIIH